MMKVKIFSLAVVFFSVMFVSSYSQTKDSVIVKKPEKFSYTDVMYAGFIYDLHANYSNKGAWGLSIGYRRLIEINEKCGFNFIASFNCFYNSYERYESNFNSTYVGNTTSTQNFFSVNVHAAPSFTFPHRIVVYGGLGVCYIQTKEFYDFSSSFYGLKNTEFFDAKFSQILGFEHAPSERFALNFEYIRTEVNYFITMKAGMRF